MLLVSRQSLAGRVARKDPRQAESDFFEAIDFFSLGTSRSKNRKKNRLFVFKGFQFDENEGRIECDLGFQNHITNKGGVREDNMIYAWLHLLVRQFLYILVVGGSFFISLHFLVLLFLLLESSKARRTIWRREIWWVLQDGLCSSRGVVLFPSY